MSKVFLVNGIRSPFGKNRGSLSGVRPDDLAASVIRGALDKTGLADSSVDEVIFGCANQAGEDNRNVARMSSLLAGLPDSVPGFTVNRLCASGLTSIGSAYLQVAGGEADVVIAGGVESMSRAPWVMARPARALAGPTEVVDSALGWRFVNNLMTTVDDGNATVSLGETAERVAELDHVERDRCDVFSLRSHKRATTAWNEGSLADEVMAIHVDGVDVERDEGPRSDASLEGLAALKPVFRTEGVVTAGSSSQLSDGAAAVVVASQTAVDRYGLKPLAVIRGSASAGVPPSLMGLGPVPATQKLLTRTGVSIDQLDVVEINEAFAPQVLACVDRLGIDEHKINQWGGAIALGHPLGASGTRLALTAARQLHAHSGRYALVTLCVGVGQGTSLLLERT